MPETLANQMLDMVEILEIYLAADRDDVPETFRHHMRVTASKMARATLTEIGAL